MGAGRDMRARLLLTLVDRASSGLRAFQQRLASLVSSARRMSSMGGLFAAGAAFSMAAAIRSAAEYEGKLRDIAITAGNTGRAVNRAVERMRVEDQALARQNAERSTDLSSARGVLISRGMDEAQAGQYMEVLARFASASGAAAEDIANLTFSLHRLSNIRSVEGIERAYAIAMRAGQLGGFEVRDMARHLGAQLGRAGAKGLTGHQAVATMAAMNQLARDPAKGPDHAGEAVNQALAQMSADDFRKRFIEKLQMDPRAVTEHARRTGRDPVFALLQRIEQVTRGRRNVLEELIPDQNAFDAINAVVTNWDQFRRIRDDSGRAQVGAITQAATDRQQGLAADMRRFNEEFDQLGRNLGQLGGILLPPLNAALRVLNDLLAGLNRIIESAITLNRNFEGEQRERRENVTPEQQRRIELYNRLFPGQRPPAAAPGANPIQPQSAPAPQQRSELHGRIEIALAPGLVLRRGETDTPGVSLTPDRGLMLRPV